MKKLWLQFSGKFGRSILHPQFIVKEIEHRAIEFARMYARGKLLDIGCGTMPYKQELLEFVDEYVGLDHPVTKKMYPGAPSPDVLGDAKKLPFKKNSFDSILMLQVLEHVDDPLSAISEAHRVLKKGGILIVSIPFMYPLHDMPHDFTRFTVSAIKNILSPQFKIKKLSHDGTFIEFWLQSLILFLLFKAKAFVDNKNPIGYALGIIFLVITFPIALVANIVCLIIKSAHSQNSHPTNIFPLNYTLVAKKL